MLEVSDKPLTKKQYSQLSQLASKPGLYSEVVNISSKPQELNLAIIPPNSQVISYNKLKEAIIDAYENIEIFDDDTNFSGAGSIVLAEFTATKDYIWKHISAFCHISGGTLLGNRCMLNIRLQPNGSPGGQTYFQWNIPCYIGADALLNVELPDYKIRKNDQIAIWLRFMVSGIGSVAYQCKVNVTVVPSQIAFI
jgi:hypothetical protein